MASADEQAELARQVLSFISIESTAHAGADPS
jgi:hypothetical protein